MNKPLGAIFVTGASSGIGLACSRALAERGFHVFAGMRQGSIPRGVEHDSGRITSVTVDLASDTSIAQAVKQLSSELPVDGLSGLVNCAGAGLSGPLEYLSRTALNDLFNLNVTGQLRLIQEVLPLLRIRGGRIVNVGSTSGRIPSAFNGAYCASKFALEALTSVLRAELASTGISVSMVEPGVVGTPFWDKLATNEVRLLDSLPEEGRRRYGGLLARRQQQLPVLRATGQSAEAVCHAILHAVCADQPKRRYVVGTQARIKLGLWATLPEFLRDRILLRALR